MKRTAISTNVHLAEGVPLRVTVLGDSGHRGPFVAVDLGSGEASVSLFVDDEDTANRLVAVMGEARAKLVGALTRAKAVESGQPELLAS